MKRWMMVLLAVMVFACIGVVIFGIYSFGLVGSQVGSAIDTFKSTVTAIAVTQSAAAANPISIPAGQDVAGGTPTPVTTISTQLPAATVHLSGTLPPPPQQTQMAVGTQTKVAEGYAYASREAVQATAVLTTWALATQHYANRTATAQAGKK